MQKYILPRCFQVHCFTHSTTCFRRKVMHNIPQQIWLKYTVYHIQSWFSKILQLKSKYSLCPRIMIRQRTCKNQSRVTDNVHYSCSEELTDCSKGVSMVALALNTEQWGRMRWQLSILNKKKKECK